MQPYNCLDLNTRE